MTKKIPGFLSLLVGFMLLALVALPLMVVGFKPTGNVILVVQPFIESEPVDEQY